MLLSQILSYTGLALVATGWLFFPMGSKDAIRLTTIGCFFSLLGIVAAVIAILTR